MCQHLPGPLVVSGATSPYLEYAILTEPCKAVVTAEVQCSGMSPRDDSAERREGITTTGVKKTIWFHEDEAEALRRRAFEDRRSESSLVREAVRKLLRIQD